MLKASGAVGSVNAGTVAAHDGALAEIRLRCPVSVVVPTFREVENIPHLIERIAAVREVCGVAFEVLFMDDMSRDGSAEVVAASGLDWVRLVERPANHGLSQAVIDGMRLARYPVIVCMDCDLSHPPERIPELVLLLAGGQQFAIGSRYVPGGSTDDDWGMLRWLNSQVATLLAWPLTDARDPMSGFFAIRRADFLAAKQLNPVGYKIGLELIVKCGLENVGEVPIHFTDRVRGQSKLSLREQLRYLQHVRRLYMFKFATAMELVQFLAVGASGVVVNLAVLTGLAAMGLPGGVALFGGVAVSVLSNFALNRRFTFGYARGGNLWRQMAGFIGVTAVGAAVNYAVALAVLAAWLSQVRFGLQLAAMVGVVAGMAFNFLGNRFLVFRKRTVRRGPGVSEVASAGAEEGV